MIPEAALFNASTPPTLDGVDLRCVSVEALLASCTEDPALVVADPPWSSRVTNRRGSASGHYKALTMAEIVASLDAAWDVCGDSGRLVLWATFPQLHDLIPLMNSTRWRYVTGGAWHKVGRPGIGFHWRGDSEPVLVFVKGRPPRPSTALSSGHAAARRKHSEKPVAWMAQWIEGWTQPGDLVLDLYAGLAPLARSCGATGRRYLGAEIDPVRHAQALDLLAFHGGRRC